MIRSRILVPAIMAVVAGTALGQVTLQAGVNYSTPARPGGIVAADLNGDGRRDLAVTTDTPDKISLLFNTGAGAFAPPVNILIPNGSGVGAIVAADFNGDHNIDLAVAYQNLGSVQVFLGNGAGSFSPGGTFTVGSNPRGLIAMDLNGDGAPDMAVANRDSSTVSVLLNNGSASFAVTSFPVGTEPRSLAAADITGDGRPELFAPNHGSRNVSVLINNGSGSGQPRR
jgi:hypothetical protein